MTDVKTSKEEEEEEEFNSEEWENSIAQVFEIAITGSIEYYRKELQDHPEDAQVHNLLGSYLVEYGLNNKPEAVKEGIQLLKKALELNPEEDYYWNTYGNACQKIEDFPEALMAFSKAKLLRPDNDTYQYDYLLCQSKQELAIQKKLLEEKISRKELLPNCPDRMVERRSNLSYQEFEKEFLIPRKPVIITDWIEKVLMKTGKNKERWTFSGISKEAGESKVVLRRVKEKSQEWGGLEDDTKTDMTIGQFIEKMIGNQFPPDSLPYIFDWSIPSNLPHLLEDFIIPKYFTHDLVRRVPFEVEMKQSFPSLFIGKMHVDALGTHFWMMLFEGQKEWRFFDSEQTSLLYPKSGTTFETDAFKPNFQKFPLFSYASCWTCILQPGEMLFVPCGSPHQVRNLSNSLAISYNFIDHTNYKHAIEQILLEQTEEDKGIVKFLSDPLLDPKPILPLNQDIFWKDFNKL